MDVQAVSKVCVYPPQTELDRRKKAQPFFQIKGRLHILVEFQNSRIPSDRFDKIRRLGWCLITNCFALGTVLTELDRCLTKPSVQAGIILPRGRTRFRNTPI